MNQISLWKLALLEGRPDEKSGELGVRFCTKVSVFFGAAFDGQAHLGDGSFGPADPSESAGPSPRDSLLPGSATANPSDQ
jgi:hypothetical protein